MLKMFNELNKRAMLVVKAQETMKIDMRELHSKVEKLESLVGEIKTLDERPGQQNNSI